MAVGSRQVYDSCQTICLGSTPIAADGVPETGSCVEHHVGENLQDNLQGARPRRRGFLTCGALLATCLLGLALKSFRGNSHPEQEAAHAASSW
jgi:hypothetical protein